MASELKPCPFCQYKAHEWIRGNKKMACCDNMDCPCRAIVCTVEQWNTRPAPAATDTGLVTVGGEYLDGHTWKPMPAGVTDFALRGFKTRALCDRSQAVELLAAERHERDMLKADFNDINAERQRWRDRAEKAEADNAAKVEQERLRFEGDLDKWMKIIGAGITGYQPEAYALMDLACHELVKLRSDISAIAGHVDCEADSDSILHIIRELEADNAALTARVEELDRCHEGTIDLCNQKTAQIEALEAKLAAGKITFHLEWIAAARKPVHPEPMTGRQSFSSFDEAIAFMKRQAPDAQFVSLTERTIIQTDEDRSTEARAVLGGKPS